MLNLQYAETMELTGSGVGKVCKWRSCVFCQYPRVGGGWGV